MQLHAIIYFNELVRSRSIRQAAETLGVSATAISRQLENLEYYFGAPLVIRGARGIVLTSAGEALATRSKSMMRDLDTAKQVIDDLKGLKRGNVSIHFNGAAINAILAPALAKFHRLYPAISIEVFITSAQEAINAVISGNTDMAVTMFSPPDQQMDVRFKMQVLHDVVMAPEHPLAQLDEISLEDIREYPIAMPDRSFGIRRAFDQNQRNAGIEPIEAAFTTSSLELQKELARQCAAVVILPAMSVLRDIKLNALVARPFQASSVIDSSLQLGRSKSSAPSFAAAKLADFLEQFLPTQAKLVQKK